MDTVAYADKFRIFRIQIKLSSLLSVANDPSTMHLIRETFQRTRPLSLKKAHGKLIREEISCFTL